jgi:hypothetical protein
MYIIYEIFNPLIVLATEYIVCSIHGKKRSSNYLMAPIEERLKELFMLFSVEYYDIIVNGVLLS